MSSSILATKLYIPPLRPKVVRRPRLVERLRRGAHRNLTLISAPAGFGKTTLVCEWAAQSRRPVAWLSLDDEEKDISRFLVYLVAALQTIAPHGMDTTCERPQRRATLTDLWDNPNPAAMEKYAHESDRAHKIRSAG